MPLALSDDLSVFLADFGVTVTSGAIVTTGILDMPTEIVENGMVLTTEYQLTARTDQLGSLTYGDGITVDGVNYQVREVRQLDDGMFCVLTMAKLAPGATAPGGQLRQFGLDDLSDVALANPVAGEVLKYDGAQWVDGTDEGAAYVFTQSAPSATWIINHNLGHVPSVEVFDSGSQEVDADVSHPSANQAIILFTVPITGFARLI